MTMLGLGAVEWGMLILSALIVGFSKAGIQGATIPAVAMMAIIFGGKESAGIMLPMLMVGDLVAIFKYGKKGNMRDVLRLMPIAIIGIILGALVGGQLDDSQFKFLLGVIVLVCLLLLVTKQIKKQSVDLPDNKMIHWLVGMTSGFSSMVGNAAGPIFNVYILAQNLNKEKMIGTTAWFFFLMNALKVPFHVLLWDTIGFETLKYTAVAVPFIGIGALAGIWIIQNISEKWYRRLIIVMTVVAAVRLLM